MRLAHLADPHLGYRSSYNRSDVTGRSVRELDVMAAFRSAIDGIIAARPDAVLIAGDLFHVVRPSNATILDAFREVRRLREALPDAPVVLIAGNHDTPRTSETGSPLALFAELGVDVALGAAQRFTYPALDLAVLAAPHAALMQPERATFTPSGTARHEVLMLHGDVPGAVHYDRALAEHGGAGIQGDDLAGWSYVALGHYHLATEVAPMVWYAGATEYVTSDLWREARAGVPKGWLLVDLDTRAVTLMPVTVRRRIIDLPVIAAHGLSPEELLAAMADALETIPGGLAGAVVRLVVADVPRETQRRLEWATIRRWRASALHLHLTFRHPVVAGTVTAGQRVRARPLEELLAEKLAGYALPSDLDREAFVARGLALITEEAD